MPWMPGAIKRPLTRNVGPKRTRTDGVIHHVDAGNATTLFHWFNTGKKPDGSPVRDSCHFYVTKAGVIEQYADTDLTTYTSGGANWRTIGVETQGYGAGTWTAAQIEALAKIDAWCYKTHGVPLELMDSSRSTERGIGWHRLGIDGNFPALPDIRAGRLQRGGGELWSKSEGKECPGGDRIRQMPAVLKRAKEIAGGTSTLGSGTTSTSGTTYPIPTRTLRLGDTGSDVKWVQDGLKRRYSYASTIAVDGSYGNATKGAVTEFQRRTGLATDGVTGTATRDRMRKEWGL